VTELNAAVGGVLEADARHRTDGLRGMDVQELTDNTAAHRATLSRRLQIGIGEITAQIEDPLEAAIVIFLFCVRHRFFGHRDIETGALLMNGHLMTNGLPPIVVPASLGPMLRPDRFAPVRTDDFTPLMAALLEGGGG
jgi:hypothetical protein